MLVLLLLVAIVLVIFGRWFAHTPPERIKAALRRTLWAVLAALFLLLVLTGRMHWVFALIGGAIPLIQQAILAWRRAKILRDRLSPNGGSSGPRHSKVDTRYLRMELNHESGELNGEVLEGPYQGRQLNELTRSALLDLLRHIQQDNESARLLESYLDRRFGPEWRDEGARSGPGTEHHGGPMTEAEALDILGLAPGAGPDEIRAAHRRLMQNFHPDRGGSTYLAAKINQAKDVLLGK
ncbi:MAG TPA: molecular chaperone DnaJ [Gammaproteobacteria bacterium]|nr:molecular chaperone DnaJ [Gammaproteobacteria bacterium]